MLGLLAHVDVDGRCHGYGDVRRGLAHVVGVQMIPINVKLEAHGSTLPASLPVDPADILELTRQDGNHGVLVMTDGTRLPISNAMDVCEALMMGLEDES